VNRAVALAERAGAAAGLAALREAAADARLEGYQPYWAALGALSAKLGDGATAEMARRRAAGLSTDPAVRDFLLATPSG
jgi:RNA polymerase sigma-70 factor (ECF subfamily)